MQTPEYPGQGVYYQKDISSSKPSHLLTDRFLEAEEVKN